LRYNPVKHVTEAFCRILRKPACARSGRATAHENLAGAWGIPELMPPVGGGCTTAHESLAGALGIPKCMPPIRRQDFHSKKKG